METSTRNFNYSKGDLMSNLIIDLVLNRFLFVRLLSCSSAIWIRKEWKSQETPHCFCSKLVCDFSPLMKLLFFLLTLTMSPLIRVQQHGNGLYKLLQMPNNNNNNKKGRECQEEVGMTDNNTSEGKRMIIWPLGIKVYF